MKQAQFEAQQAPLWAQYRELLEALERAWPRRRPALDWHLFPSLFRQLCSHYALARVRGYSPGLVDELHDLVQRGYRQIYRARHHWTGATLEFLATGFPRALRRQAGAFWLAAALFFGPMLAMGLACHVQPNLIYSLLEASEVMALEVMYDPANDRPGRPADSDFAAFGFYVMNNVGVAFRTFAGGLLFGLGSLFFLTFNGLVIGAVAGHLTQLGFGATFWSFVSGHSALELTAIVISGAAGLRLAAALLAPGRRRRLDALRYNAREAVQLVTGALLLLVAAAAVEGFWSATPAPAWIKYLVGGGGWGLLILYLTLAGRGDGERHAD